MSISKEVNVQVQEEEEKKILSPIPEVITELTPSASLSDIESMVGKEDSVKDDDDNVKNSAVVEDQSIQEVSTTLDIYSAMLNEAEPYLTLTSTKSMKMEEVSTVEKEEAEVVVEKEERLLVVDSVDSTDDNNERQYVSEEVVEEEVEKDLAPDISTVFDGNEEKTSVVGEDRIGFDSSSSNPQKVDDDVVGKDVTVPSSKTRKPLVRTLDFGDDIDKGDDEVVVLEEQPVKMSEGIIKSESYDNKPDKKGRILHIRTKRKINKGGIKMTMKKILPSFGRSKSNKAEQLLAATEQGEIITDVKVIVPSPKAVGMPVSPSAMSIISVESSIVVSNDSGTIIKTTPVISGSPPQDLLYGAINYDFKKFDEHSDSHSDAQPVESRDEEEDSEIISVKVIEQARISDNDSVATEGVVLVAPEEDIKEIKIEVVSSDTPKTEAMKLTHPESTFQKEAEIKDVNESILNESNDISYLDEYQQALLASYIHDMDAEEEDDTDAEEDDEGYLQASDVAHSNQTSIVHLAIDSKAVKDIIEEEEPAIFIGDVNDVENEPEDEPVITKHQKSTIKLSVETGTPSPSASSKVVSKKSFEIQKRKIASATSRTSTFPKSASKKCSNGLVKSRISDIQQ